MFQNESGRTNVYVQNKENINKFLDGLFDEMDRTQVNERVMDQSKIQDSVEGVIDEAKSQDSVSSEDGESSDNPKTVTDQEAQGLENNTKSFHRDLESVTLSQWSRGEVFQNNQIIKVFLKY